MKRPFSSPCKACTLLIVAAIVGAPEPPHQSGAGPDDTANTTSALDPAETTIQSVDPKENITFTGDGKARAEEFGTTLLKSNGDSQWTGQKVTKVAAASQSQEAPKVDPWTKDKQQQGNDGTGWTIFLSVALVLVATITLANYRRSKALERELLRWELLHLKEIIRTHTEKKMAPGEGKGDNLEMVPSVIPPSLSHLAKFDLCGSANGDVDLLDIEALRNYRRSSSLEGGGPPGAEKVIAETNNNNLSIEDKIIVSKALRLESRRRSVELIATSLCCELETKQEDVATRLNSL